MHLHKLHEFTIKIDPLVAHDVIHVTAETFEKLKDRITGKAEDILDKHCVPWPDKTAGPNPEEHAQ